MQVDGRWMDRGKSVDEEEEFEQKREGGRAVDKEGG